MGQSNGRENNFRTAIVNGLIRSGIKFSSEKRYNNLNYGLIIKPLNLDYNFREPIQLYFKGYPYHVGIIRDNTVYSFCPDLKEPHRGTLIKDLIFEDVSTWNNAEIFWFLDNPKEMTYLRITARLIDLLSIKKEEISVDEFNRRHNTNIKMLYSLLSNNCTDTATTVLLGKTVCFQIESIVHTILHLAKMEQIVNMLPPYAKIWLADFKYVN